MSVPVPKTSFLSRKIIKALKLTTMTDEMKTIHSNIACSMIKPCARNEFENCVSKLFKHTIGKPIAQPIAQIFHSFKWLASPFDIIRFTHLFERLSKQFERLIKPFKQFIHQFKWFVHPFKIFTHPFKRLTKPFK